MERTTFDADAKLKEAMERRGEVLKGVQVVATQAAVAQAERSPVVFGYEAQMPIGFAVAAAHMKKESFTQTN